MDCRKSSHGQDENNHCRFTLHIITFIHTTTIQPDVHTFVAEKGFTQLYVQKYIVQQILEFVRMEQI